jgi:hypothetical protein
VPFGLTCAARVNACRKYIPHPVFIYFTPSSTALQISICSKAVMRANAPIPQ